MFIIKLKHINCYFLPSAGGYLVANQWSFALVYWIAVAHVTIQYVLFNISAHVWPIHHFLHSPQTSLNSNMIGIGLLKHAISDYG